MKRKTYVLLKACPNIGKEEGDYYVDEYSESIESLIARGVIEEIEEEEEREKTPEEEEEIHKMLFGKL